MSETPSLDRHLHTLQRAEHADKHDVDTAIQALDGKLAELKTRVQHKDELRKMRAGIEKAMVRTDLSADSQKRLKTMQSALEDEAVEAPVIPSDEGDSLPTRAVKEGVQMTVEQGKYLWKKTEGNTLARVGLIGGAVIAGYAVLHAGKWVLEKLWNGVKHVGSFMKEHWMLTIGALAGGAYLYSNATNTNAADTHVERPAPAGSEYLLGGPKLIEVNGKRYTVEVRPDASLTVNGKNWKLKGLGLASVATFSVGQAMRTPNGDLQLQVAGEIPYIYKSPLKTHVIPKAKAEALLEHLATQNTPAQKQKVEGYEIQMQPA